MKRSRKTKSKVIGWVLPGPYLLINRNGDVLKSRSDAPKYEDIISAESVGYHWVRQAPYQLINAEGKVQRTSPYAPTCEDIADAEHVGQRWVPRDEKTHRLINKKGRVVEEWEDAPTPRDIAAATKAGYHWDTIASAKTEVTYKLIKPAQYADEMFALLDFDMRGPNGLSDDDEAEIRENVQPDPQDFIYVELRSHQIKGYVKIRNFIEILEFLGKRPRPSDIANWKGPPNGLFIGSGDEPPAWTPDRIIPYNRKYVWIPSSQEQRKRDLEAFYWLYTLYQLSVVDTTKLPQVPVTISK